MKATRRPRQLWKEPGEGGRMRTARESSEGEGKNRRGRAGGREHAVRPDVHTSPRDRLELVSEKIDPAADLIHKTDRITQKGHILIKHIDR